MNNIIPDFESSVEVANTSAGPAIDTIKIPDFANSVELIDEPKIPQRNSVISRIARFVFRGSPLEQMQTSIYLQDKIPDINKDESLTDYADRVDKVLEPREKEIIGEGVGRVLEKPMEGAIALSGMSAPLQTAAFMGGYMALDKFVNLRRFIDKNLPDTLPEIKDVVEIADFLIKGGIIGKGMIEGKKLALNRMEALGIKKNINITAEQVSIIKDKPEILKTLDIKPEQAEASINSGLPINIPTEKILDLAEKPGWDKTKENLIVPVETPKVVIDKVKTITGTGETKTRGLAKGVEEKAIENKLTETFKDLPEYQTVNIKEQAGKARDLLTKDYEKARRIAMGEELAPNDIVPEMLFKAVEDKAIREQDISTLRDLATSSGLTEEATTMGQRLRVLAERNPESPVTAINEIAKAREQGAIKRLKTKDVKKAKKEVIRQVRAEIKKIAPTKESWSDFIRSIQC